MYFLSLFYSSSGPVTCAASVVWCGERLRWLRWSRHGATGGGEIESV